MKIVITNGWSDLNSGDSGIIMGIIEDLVRCYGDIVEIAILSELHENNKFFVDSIVKIRETFPNLTIHLISSPFFKSYSDSGFNKLREFISLLKNTILFRLSYKRNDYYKHIANANIIISKGGHFLFDRRGVRGWVHLYKCLYPLRVAKKIGKKYYILGQSMGPFYNKKLFEKMKLDMSLNVLNHAELVSFREKVSLDKMKELGLNNENIKLTSDYAFLVNKKKVSAFKLDKFVAVTLRQHNFSEEDGEVEYLATIRNICNTLNSKFGVNILVIPHVKGPNDFENDVTITKKFEKMVEEYEFYHFDYEYYSAPELIDIYSRADMLIGTRFHSVIFSLISSVPAFAISYSGYKANIIEQFGMEKFMIDINSVNKEKEMLLSELLCELYSKRKDFSEHIEYKMPTILNTIRENTNKAFLGD